METQENNEKAKRLFTQRYGKAVFMALINIDLPTFKNNISRIDEFDYIILMIKLSLKRAYLLRYECKREMGEFTEMLSLTLARMHQSGKTINYNKIFGICHPDYDISMIDTEELKKLKEYYTPMVTKSISISKSPFS